MVHQRKSNRITAPIRRQIDATLRASRLCHTSILTPEHPRTNGLVERQNRNLLDMLKVCQSRYVSEWDRYLEEVVGIYYFTVHATAGVTPYKLLTSGREKPFAPWVLFSRVPAKEIQNGLYRWHFDEGETQHSTSAEVSKIFG